MSAAVTAIYVDADACPVKDDVYRIAERYKLHVHMVANRKIFVPERDWVTLVVAEGSFDAVDDWLVEHVQKNDIVVTGDILLAQRCIEKHTHVIDPRGRILDENNIGDAVASRELVAELRQRGEIGLGPPKMGKKHKSSFKASMDELVNKALRGKR